MNPFRALLYTLTSLLVLLWCSLTVSFAFLLFLLTGSRRGPFWAARNLWAPGLLRIARVRLQVIGLENINKSGPAIYIMNHQSFLDIPAAFAALQTNLHFIGKKELKYVPFVGWYMQLVGMIFVDRKSGTKAIASIKETGKLIRQGKTVLAFPEGTRSRSGQIGSFKKGIFMSAIEAKVPMIPVAVDGAMDLLPYGKFMIRPGKIRIAIGSPMDLSQTTPDQRAQMIEDARNRLIQLHAQLQAKRGGNYSEATVRKN